mgnify:CR=1 FL=1
MITCPLTTIYIICHLRPRLFYNKIPYISRDILKNIDLYLENILEPEKVDDFYCMLIYRLNSMIKSLNTINNDLKKSQQRYYNTWNLVNRPGYDQQPSSYTNLGYAKKEWRLSRNKAVRAILDFYNELESINIALYYGTFQFQEENYGLDQATLEISQNYNNGINNRNTFLRWLFILWNVY